MIAVLEQSIRALPHDPWRDKVGFSDDLAPELARLTEAQTTADREAILAGWLAARQPCLFGRLSAKAGALDYCFLTEGDLSKGDEFVRDRIQDARRHWTTRASQGLASGFVIVVISPLLAAAEPCDAAATFARRLVELYLRKTANFDSIELESVLLEAPGSPSELYVWSAGVNYFSAQADKRWWHDHRIPAGMALSVNSVGHMVKSGLLKNQLAEFHSVVSPTSAAKVAALPKALELAMRTIELSCPTAPSGKATELLPTEAGEHCPINVPEILSGRSQSTYVGKYHTDFTLPSEYFRPDVVRPEGLITHRLDLTYLHDFSLENPDAENLGRGRRIRLESSCSRDVDDRSSKTISRRVPRIALEDRF